MLKISLFRANLKLSILACSPLHPVTSEACAYLSHAKLWFPTGLCLTMDQGLPPCPEVGRLCYIRISGFEAPPHNVQWLRPFEVIYACEARKRENCNHRKADDADAWHAVTD